MHRSGRRAFRFFIRRSITGFCKNENRCGYACIWFKYAGRQMVSVWMTSERRQLTAIYRILLRDSGICIEKQTGNGLKNPSLFQNRKSRIMAMT